MKSGCVHVVEVGTACVGAMAAYFLLGGTLTSSVKMSSTKARAMARSSRIINWLKVSPSRRTSMAQAVGAVGGGGDAAHWVDDTDGDLTVVDQVGNVRQGRGVEGGFFA